MQAIVEIKLNSNTQRIPITLIEGIDFFEKNYRKPNASNSFWVLKAKINVSPDKILGVSCMAIGRSLHKADAAIKVKYRKNGKLIEKTENIEDDSFSERGGIILFKKELRL